VFDDDNIVMGFPDPAPSHIGRAIDNLSRFLAHHHPHHYMLWNLSEKTYDYKKFEDQVELHISRCINHYMRIHLCQYGEIGDRIQICWLSSSSIGYDLHYLQFNSWYVINQCLVRP
jgi:hypothetical protein